jgi:hypothetical protein
VLARGLTPTDDSSHQWQVSCTPNGDTVSGAIQVQLMSAGPPPTPPPPGVPLTTDAGTAILTNDNGTITSYNVVGPTGGDDTAMLNSAFAGAASRPVFLSFGTYNVSGPLTIADYGVVVGEEINAWDYYNGVRPRTLLQVINSNSFAQNSHNPSAVVNIGNYSHIRGFSIFGEKTLTPERTSLV